MNYQELRYEQRGRLALLTLNRPERLNAWTASMEVEMRDALERANRDPAVHAVVLTGAGRGFCAGADMAMLKARSDGGESSPKVFGTTPTETREANFSQRLSYLLRLRKPLIAAINGAVAGIGLCMALYCDIRLMAPGAKLSTAFARRGLIAEHGIAWMLPRLIGPMAAFDLLYSGRVVTAEEAQQMGLVRVLEAADFLAAALAYTDELIAASSPRSLCVIRRQIYAGLFQDLGEATRLADEELALSLRSADFKEGIDHYLQKRPPRFAELGDD